MTTNNTVAWESIREELLADPTVKAEYDALEAEFNLAQHIIALRKVSGLSQRDFADRVGIKQPQLARIESGKQMPKLETLMKLASGAGYTLEVHFVSEGKKKVPHIAPLQIPSKPLVKT
jgi:DNA-binding XRE family transcriptional regulator